MKRILALIGVGLLVLLYVLTLIFALIKSPEAVYWFQASLVATILVPCLIYAYQLIYRVLNRHDEEPAAKDAQDVQKQEKTEDEASTY